MPLRTVLMRACDHVTRGNHDKHGELGRPLMASLVVLLVAPPHRSVWCCCALCVHMMAGFIERCTACCCCRYAVRTLITLMHVDRTPHHPHGTHTHTHTVSLYIGRETTIHAAQLGPVVLYDYGCSYI